jgi:hypothetical protein
MGDHTGKEVVVEVPLFYNHHNRAGVEAAPLDNLSDPLKARGGAENPCQEAAAADNHNTSHPVEEGIAPGDQSLWEVSNP